MNIAKLRNRINLLVPLTLMVAVIFSTITVSAKPVSAGVSAPNTAVQQNSYSTKKAIIGSWIETVTFDGAVMPPLKSLVTFSADGTISVADQGNVNLAAGQLFSAGKGAWLAQGDRTFSWTVLELISDLGGNLIGTLKVRGTYTVSDSGNAYSGVFYAEVRDSSDNILFSVGGTNTGVRIQVEPMP